MSNDLARLLADVTFLAGAIIASLERKFATALVAIGLFCLSLAAALRIG